MLLLHFVMALVLKAKTWMNNLDDLIERKFAVWTACRTPKRRSVRLLGPEDLEARVTPASVDLWVGPAGGNWSSNQNWSINGKNGVPLNGDTLQFGGSVGGVNGQNTSSVDDLQGVNPGSLVITGNYNQTITLNQNL